MIAAMAAAVSAPSTFRLTSDGAGFVGRSTGSAFSGKLALVAEIELLDELEVGAAAIGCGAGATKATGLAITGVGTATGALLAGALWRPTE
jgi:hypothetical protein